ncbi:hypothetical protein [Sulfitobacter sp. NAS-14.1]|jgi:hypothetical protein|uniref:hypothetical protein n=1 Tax=Sulfitobacter TaxID=60136 RepID=UPI000066B2C5|nr:hypothetical protein [Sulfitobacter sp. NAS-14.1]EAP79241.1 hypothetical protein NAS141_19264 [Sulfitobacter sp. NAS-14.1]
MVKIAQPAINLRGELAADPKPLSGIMAARKQIPADGVQVAFKVPVGYKAYAVDSAGLIRVEGELEEYAQKFDGFQWVVIFAQAPANGAIVGIWPVGV